MKLKFFATPDDWRDWLQKNHASALELWVGFHKKKTGRPTITWPQSVDEALCFGWIDGVRRSIDANSYAIRFTPRRARCIWSNINTRRAHELIAEGRMEAPGRRAFEVRDPKRSGVYSFEQDDEPTLKRAELAEFKSNPDAWKFFQQQPPGYRRLATRWVVTAKRDDTRARRLSALILDSAAGRRIGPLRRPGT